LFKLACLCEAHLGALGTFLAQQGFLAKASRARVSPVPGWKRPGFFLSG